MKRAREEGQHEIIVLDDDESEEECVRATVSCSVSSSSSSTGPARKRARIEDIDRLLHHDMPRAHIPGCPPTPISSTSMDEVIGKRIRIMPEWAEGQSGAEQNKAWRKVWRAANRGADALFYVSAHDASVLSTLRDQQFERSIVSREAEPADIEIPDLPEFPLGEGEDLPLLQLAREPLPPPLADHQTLVLRPLMPYAPHDQDFTVDSKMWRNLAYKEGCRDVMQRLVNWLQEERDIDCQWDGHWRSPLTIEYGIGGGGDNSED